MVRILDKTQRPVLLIWMSIERRSPLAATFLLSESIFTVSGSRSPGILAKVTGGIVGLSVLTSTIHYSIFTEKDC